MRIVQRSAEASQLDDKMKYDYLSSSFPMEGLRIFLTTPSRRGIRSHARNVVQDHFAVWLCRTIFHVFPRASRCSSSTNGSKGPMIWWKFT